MVGGQSGSCVELISTSRHCCALCAAIAGKPAPTGFAYAASRVGAGLPALRPLNTTHQQPARTTTVHPSSSLARKRDRPVTVLTHSGKKNCPSSVRFPRHTSNRNTAQPIVEQFTHLLWPALGSGLDSFSRGKNCRSQTRKKVETFAEPGGSSQR